MLYLCCAALLWIGSPAPRPAHQEFVTEYALDRDVVEIPFDYVDHEILVKGSADKHADLTFLVDSGASSPVLDPAVVGAGYHLGDTRFKEAEGVTSAEQIWVSDMRIGEGSNQARVTNIAALVSDLSQPSRVIGRKVDGILGLPFLDGFVTQIDYQRHVLRLYAPAQSPVLHLQPTGRQAYLIDLTAGDAKRANSVLLVSGKLHEKYDYDFLLDTGFGGYVSVAEAAAVESGLLRKDTPRVAGANYSLSREFRSDKIRARYLWVGPIDVSGHVIQVDYRNSGQEGQAGIIGNRFLQSYDVTIDYRRHKLLLERAGAPEEAEDAGRPALGFAVRDDGATLRVERVVPASPAKRAGLHPGDEIVSVNGETVNNDSLRSVLKLLANPQGPTTLAVRHAVDPNLGTQAASTSVTLVPSSPLDWQ